MKKRATSRSASSNRRTRVIRRRSSALPAATRGGSSRSGKTTIDHNEIKRWVEAHGGHPALVKRTRQGGKGGGVLRIDFPGFSGEKSLAPVSWDEWFEVFDERALAFLYQNKKDSRFNKLINRRGGQGKRRGS